MNKRFKDETGKRYGRLVVIKRVENIGSAGAFLCKCDCGNEKIVTGNSLRTGATKSCGCLLVEHAKENGKIFVTHGLSRTRLHKIWMAMRARCSKPHNTSYFKYGARGIKVCDEWQDFMTFAKWAYNNGYSDSLSIDRIDNNGNYEPNNCRWTDAVTQANNTRRNVFLLYHGEKKTMTEWCRELNVPVSRIKERLKKGWSVSDALEKPPLKRRDRNVI
jgi:hypothetical protein